MAELVSDAGRRLWAAALTARLRSMDVPCSVVADRDAGRQVYVFLVDVDGERFAMAQAPDMESTSWIAERAIAIALDRTQVVSAGWGQRGEDPPTL